MSGSYSVFPYPVRTMKTKKKQIMPIVDKQKFSQAKVDKLYNLLQLNIDNGTPQDYSIFVDGILVVKRTDNLDRFEDYTDFVEADTRDITIRIYNDRSRRNDKYIFMMQSEGEVLDGLEGSFAEKMELQRQQHEYERLRESYGRLEKELQEANEYIDDLEGTIGTMKRKKFHMGNLDLGQLGAVVLEGFVKRNPQLLGGLVGDGESEALAGPSPVPNDSKVTITRTRTEDNCPFLPLLKHLQETFSDEQLGTVFLILEILGKRPEEIAQVYTYLTKEENGSNQQ